MITHNIYASILFKKIKWVVIWFLTDVCCHHYSILMQKSLKHWNVRVYNLFFPKRHIYKICVNTKENERFWLNPKLKISESSSQFLNAYYFKKIMFIHDYFKYWAIHLCQIQVHNIDLLDYCTKTVYINHTLSFKLVYTLYLPLSKTQIIFLVH